MSRQQIIEKIELYSAKELAELAAVVEQIELKRVGRPAFEDLAGAWADMDDVLYNEIAAELRTARQNDKIGRGSE